MVEEVVLTHTQSKLLAIRQPLAVSACWLPVTGGLFLVSERGRMPNSISGKRPVRLSDRWAMGLLWHAVSCVIPATVGTNLFQ